MRQASLVLFLGLLLALGSAAAQNETANETAANETGGSPAVNETGEGEAPAAPPGPVTLVLEGHGQGTTYFFTLEGRTARNPQLNVAPGSEVTVTLKTVSGAIHNFCTNASGAKVCTPLVGEGREGSVTFTAPAGEGTFEYWCEPHVTAGMKGTLAVTTEPAPAEEEDEAPAEFAGETVDLGDLGYPQCAGTKIPAASAEQAVGGPTVADYVRECETGGNAGPQGRAAHGADYVIPASFALVALGIVGVAWVNRAYKP